MVTFQPIGPAEWEIPRSGDMRVPARIFANEELMKSMQGDRTVWQIQNVAQLPGIVTAANVMPDGHEGYGFPIGGVAAFDPDMGGVVSPGGVGYDINCGVRLILMDLEEKEFNAKKRELVELLFKNVPSGVGVKGKVRLQEKQLEEAVTRGVPWAVEQGWGRSEDALVCEENGCIPDADFSVVSPLARKRGLPQFGTVGAGNHFV